MHASKLRRSFADGVAFGKQHLIGLVIFALIIMWAGAAVVVFYFESAHPEANIKTLGEAFWWSLVTLLTVGYGDFVPLTTGGRVATAVLMIGGVVSVGLFTAKLSSSLLKEALYRGGRMVNPAKLNEHIIICGWKDDMPGLIEHLMSFNDGLSASDFLLIADIGDKEVASLREVKTCKHLNIIAGESFQHSNLVKTKPARARRILILADRSKGNKEFTPSAEEADARTIMTALTLQKMAPSVPITAELLNPSLAGHLEMAGITDIIYSREYSRLLLGNAFGGTGINNVIYTLLDLNTSAQLTTERIASRYVGATYLDFKRVFEEQYPDKQVIGILENTGNHYQMREKAVRDAQKTANVSDMIKNLKAAKHLDYNHPLFLPPPDYQLNDHCSAIVITVYGPGQSAKRVAS